MATWSRRFNKQMRIKSYPELHEDFDVIKKEKCGKLVKLMRNLPKEEIQLDFDFAYSIELYVQYHVELSESTPERLFDLAGQSFSSFADYFIGRRQLGRRILSIFFILAQTLRRSSVEADRLSSEDKYRRCGVELLHNQFRVYLREKSKIAFSCCLGMNLVRLYCSMNQVALARNIFQSIEQLAIPLSTQVPHYVLLDFYCYRAKLRVFEKKLDLADESFRKAWQLLPSDASVKARKKILLRWIPISFHLGRFLKRRRLRELDLDSIFGELQKSLFLGNVRQFDYEKNQLRRTLLRNDVLLLVEELKILAYQKLVEICHDTAKSHIVSLELLQTALEFAQDEASDAVCVVSQLIFCNAVRGYISYDHWKLVLSKLKPFPPTCEIDLT